MVAPFSRDQEGDLTSRQGVRSTVMRKLVLRLGLLLGVMLVAAVGGAQTWPLLKEDGVHDPRSPAVKMLLEPSMALGELAAKAPDPFIGNQVRWVHALEKGLINPRAQLSGGTAVRVLDLDIYLDVGGSMPVVRFPHKAHTLWLDCANCHEHIFKSVAGQTQIAMLKILEGEQCGQCHGAVAFPLTECKRCHSIPQAEYLELEPKLGLVRVGPKGKVAIVPKKSGAAQ